MALTLHNSKEPLTSKTIIPISPDETKSFSISRSAALKTTGFVAKADFHFPMSVFDEDERVNVLDFDDILDDLNIFPQAKELQSMLEPGFPSYVSETTSEEYQPSCRPVSPSSITSQKIKQTTLERATSFSVPNPIMKEDAAAKSDLPERKIMGNKSAVSTLQMKESHGRDKKRNLSSISVEEKELTEEELQERRERNRSHAKKSRQRKKSATSTLQQSVESLKGENQKLKIEIYQILGKQKTEAILEARKQRERDHFLAALMIPKNRIVNVPAKSFLKSLRRSIPKRDEE